MRFVIILFLFVAFSCKSNSSESSSLEDRVSQLEQENKELKEKLENGDDQLTSDNSSNYQLKTNQDNSVQSGNSLSYAIVVLSIEEKKLKDSDEMDFSNPNNNMYKTVTGYYVSNVNTVSDISDEAKYKLMDEFQNRYSTIRSFSNGRVTNREVLYFDSYQEASKARENYLVHR